MSDWKIATLPSGVIVLWDQILNSSFSFIEFAIVVDCFVLISILGKPYTKDLKHVWIPYYFYVAYILLVNRFRYRIKWFVFCPHLERGQRLFQIYEQFNWLFKWSCISVINLLYVISELETVPMCVSICPLPHCLLESYY